MKKIMILAVSAIVAANISAQEFKHECCKGKQLSKEERVEFDIKRFTQELYLSDKQAEKFAATYREYAAELDKLLQKNLPAPKKEAAQNLSDSELDQLAKQRFKGLKDLADLQERFYNKFRKDLNARQAEAVLRFNEQPFGPKPCCGEKKECKDSFGPKPENGKHHGPKHEGRHEHKPDAKPEMFMK